MNATLKLALTAAAVALATQAAAEIIIYEEENFQGRSVTAEQPINNLGREGFTDGATSVVVRGGSWEVCEDRRFRGQCVVLRPGRYSSLAAMGLNDQVTSMRAVRSNARIDERQYAPVPAPAPAPAPAQITFYEDPNFAGRSFTTEQAVLNFERFGFNDRASSAEVIGQSWEVCEDFRFSGRCAVLRPGRYPSFAAMGLNDRASSARNNTEAQAPMPAADYRRRDNERLYEAPVTSARAVLETPEQRCWVEPEQVMQDNRTSSNVPAAIAGAIVGGILGHQVGGGTGKDLATVGGVVAGAALGAQVGRNGNATSTQNVQRCETVPSRAKPRFWDVGYTFRGQVYHVQMTNQPGPTVTVNEQGEPRN